MAASPPADLSVTPGSGQTIHTLPAVGQNTAAVSLPVVLDSAVETAPGTSGSAALTVQGSANGVALPMFAASLPLPTGAATSAKQPALGVAGTPSADVLTVQGSASGTALPVSTPQLPASLGAKASSGSTSVVLASDQPALATSVADGGNATIGSKADAAPANPTTAGSVVGVLKGIWSALLGLLTVDTVVKAAATPRGATITAANTAQSLMAANAARRGFSIQNQSSGPLWFNGSGNATTDFNSFLLEAGAYFESSPHHVGPGAISIIGGTAGQAFYAREF